MKLIAYFKEYGTLILISLLSIFCYIFFAFYLERSNFPQLFITYSILFGSFYVMLKQTNLDTKSGFCLAIIFRIVFIAAIPSLSQDFYRFIWDGRMLVEGWNPYLYLPKDLIASGAAPIAEAQELYTKMGDLNASNYTNYTPINQLCFAFAGFFSGKSIVGSVIILRSILILADIGTLYFGRKLLKNLGLAPHAIWLFILNPLVIIELTGNLHFEGLMIFFLVWSLYLLQKGAWVKGAVVLALSVSVKLLPFIFLPIFFQWFINYKSVERKKIIALITWKSIGKLVAFYSIVFAIVIGLFFPFITENFFSNYQNTIRLYFQHFEFNASLYYIARWIGFEVVGWNMIKDIGKVTPILVFLFVMGISFFRNNSNFKKTVTALLFGLSFYFFTTTTMHPWYMTTLLILSVFTNYRFIVVWSFMMVFSYTAYRSDGYAENLSFVAFEYIVVYGYLTYEIFRNYTKKQRIQSF